MQKLVFMGELLPCSECTPAIDSDSKVRAKFRMSGLRFNTCQHSRTCGSRSVCGLLHNVFQVCVDLKLRRCAPKIGDVSGQIELVIKETKHYLAFGRSAEDRSYSMTGSTTTSSIEKAEFSMVYRLIKDLSYFAIGSYNPIT